MSYIIHLSCISSSGWLTHQIAFHNKVIRLLVPGPFWHVLLNSLLALYSSIMLSNFTYSIALHQTNPLKLSSLLLPNISFQTISSRIILGSLSKLDTQKPEVLPTWTPGPRGSDTFTSPLQLNSGFPWSVIDFCDYYVITEYEMYFLVTTNQYFYCDTITRKAVYQGLRPLSGHETINIIIICKWKVQVQVAKIKEEKRATVCWWPCYLWWINGGDRKM